MFNPRALLSIVVVGCAFASLALGQSAPSVDEQFAGYHRTLRGTADSILTDRAEHGEELEGNVIATSPDDQPKNFSAALNRVQRLRPLLEPILREEHLPSDVAAVVLVESGGRPTALSPKGALGLWQLMPETARRYGLTVSADRDERIDSVKATRAAARYLRDLYAQFGDWRLAFAAYNAGEQAVAKAILRIGSRDFQRLNALLPNETRAYVPAVMTARPLFGRAGNYNEGTLQAARSAHVLYASAQLDN